MIGVNIKILTIFVSSRPNKDIHTRRVGLDIQLKSVDLWLLTKTNNFPFTQSKLLSSENPIPPLFLSKLKKKGGGEVFHFLFISVGQVRLGYMGGDLS